MSTKILVLFYGYGSIVELAKEIAKGAGEEGAETRLRKVRETLYPELIEKFHVPVENTNDIPEVSYDDLRWADGLAIGSPTRYGNMAGGMKTFLDTTAPLWSAGELYGKPVTFFTESSTIHGGHETTILTMSTYAFHFGMVIVPLGYAIPEISSTTTGGSPYGSSHLGSKKGLDENEVKIARFQGKRIAQVAKKLSGS
ncbi:NAD(P)H:quinone oxidoreductase [Sulfuracidifex tepidarius]|uniref:NAD(P)H dehydrogenase n=1 Tax=Sulfuracidifex tepidarius TaxID=1294262 RepID=A0A510E150_9CREN|nr:NAD(P)H:quinone oxidoreductase [Sulfuracidifex tepidarius]BBG23467.1 NAD(P)H dehydrogenase [Sulfuracidifex tepidarius]BBG26219.1 NAD(P)H dehydrogenase (quinone) [Sulfuracidifex tepidarius]